MQLSETVWKGRGSLWLSTELSAVKCSTEHGPTSCGMSLGFGFRYCIHGGACNSHHGRDITPWLAQERTTQACKAKASFDTCKATCFLSPVSVLVSSLVRTHSLSWGESVSVQFLRAWKLFPFLQQEPGGEELVWLGFPFSNLPSFLPFFSFSFLSLSLSFPPSFFSFFSFFPFFLPSYFKKTKYVG